MSLNHNTVLRAAAVLLRKTNDNNHADSCTWQTHAEPGGMVCAELVPFLIEMHYHTGTPEWAFRSPFSHAFILFHGTPLSCRPLGPLYPPSRAPRKPVPFTPMRSWRESSQIPPGRGLQAIQQHIGNLTIFSLSDNVIFPPTAPLPWITTHGNVSLFLCLTKDILPKKDGCKKEENC